MSEARDEARGEPRGKPRGKKILVVDDVRVLAFDKDLFGECYITFARTSSDAIALLEGDWMWDELWLDFDLGRADTALPVVEKLRAERDVYSRTIPQIYVHSSNPVGRKRVVEDLYHAGYNVTPVNLLDSRLREHIQVGSIL